MNYFITIVLKCLRFGNACYIVVMKEAFKLKEPLTVPAGISVFSQSSTRSRQSQIVSLTSGQE